MDAKKGKTRKESTPIKVWVTPEEKAAIAAKADTAYRRACQLFARAAPGVTSPAALAERIALLVEKDDYGVRHSLLEHVPQFLDSETIGDRMPLLRIETLAASKCFVYLCKSLYIFLLVKHLA